jgi:hypothetical protein
MMNTIYRRFASSIKPLLYLLFFFTCSLNPSLSHANSDTLVVLLKPDYDQWLRSQFHKDPHKASQMETIINLASQVEIIPPQTYIDIFAHTFYFYWKGEQLLNYFSIDAPSLDNDKKLISHLKSEWKKKQDELIHTIDSRLYLFSVPYHRVDILPNGHILYCIYSHQPQENIFSAIGQVATFEIWQVHGNPNGVKNSINYKTITKILHMYKDLFPENESFSLEQILHLPNDIDGNPYSSAHSALVFKADTARINEIFQRPEIISLLPKNTKMAWGKISGNNANILALYLLKSNRPGKAIMDGNFIRKTTVEPTNNSYEFQTIIIYFAEWASDFFKKLTHHTAKNNEFIAFVIDDQVVNAPLVKSEIPNGIIPLNLNMSPNEAYTLSILLMTGKLPLNVQFNLWNEENKH